MNSAMNPLTEPALSAAPVVPAYRAGQRVTLIRVMHSEWTKLWSLPSTLWLLLITVVLVTGGGLLAAALQLSSLPHGAAAVAAFNPTQLSQTGVGLAELTAGALGALIMTGEYATGQVRLTFTAVPRRLPVLWGKLAALAAALLAVGTIATFAAFFITQAILAPHHLSTTVGQPGVARSVFGGALVLTGVALLGLGLGALLRNAAGAISALFGVLFGLTLVAGFLPGNLGHQVREYLPENVASDVTSMAHQAGTLGPWTGFGLFCLYTAVALGVSAWLLRRRDA
jgi:ABC-2 type transport system permease protein